MSAPTLDQMIDFLTERSDDDERFSLDERVMLRAIVDRLTRPSVDVEALRAIPREGNVKRAQSHLADARLAVNDWVSCSTAEQLDQWRQAQNRLIEAAKSVGRLEVAMSIQSLPRSLATGLNAEWVKWADVAALLPPQEDK
jgi:hypothetical protein